MAVERLGGLGELEEVCEVRGRGLMLAIEFQGPRAGDLAQKVMATAVARGMILHTAGLRHEVIRLMPPLNIEEEVLTEGLDRLAAIVREVCAIAA